jgi:hypothetical protein
MTDKDEERCESTITDDIGDQLRCEKPKGHAGTHEKGDMEWWESE